MYMDSDRESFVPTEFIEMTPQRRRALAAAVESLIALLDSLDPDPELETAATTSSPARSRAKHR